MRSEDDGNADFEPICGLIFAAVTEGVRDYYRDHPAVNHKHTVRTRRMVIRDYVVHRLRAALGKTAGVEVWDSNQTTNFGFFSRYLGRVHKLGEKLAATLGHTQASLAFQENDPAGACLGKGFEEATCIRVGYVPQPAAPMDPRVFITCPQGRANAWVMELKPAAGAAVVEVSPVPPDDGDLDDLVEVIGDEARKSDER